MHTRRFQYTELRGEVNRLISRANILMNKVRELQNSELLSSLLEETRMLNLKLAEVMDRMNTVTSDDR